MIFSKIKSIIRRCAENKKNNKKKKTKKKKNKKKNGTLFSFILKLHPIIGFSYGIHSIEKLETVTYFHKPLNKYKALSVDVQNERTIYNHIAC